MTATLLSVIEGHEHILRMLLTFGADCNQMDSCKRSLLHWAVVCAHEQCTKLILKQHNCLIAIPDLLVT